MTQLPPKELRRFCKWFEDFAAQIWDKQLEADAESGKLDKIAGQDLNEDYQIKHGQYFIR